MMDESGKIDGTATVLMLHVLKTIFLMEDLSNSLA